MPAINTSGFSVQERPRVDYLDPRLLVPAYGNIVPSIQQGLGVYGNLQEIADTAQMRPTRQRLADIQLQEAQNRLAMAPLDQQIRALQLGEAQQQALIPELLPGDTTIEDTTRIFPAALDEAGNRTGPADTVMGDLIEVQAGRSIGAGGKETPYTRRKTVKTAEQRVAEAEKQAAYLEGQKALNAQRGRGKQFESTALIELYNNALEDGDGEAAALYKARIDKINQPPGLIADGTTFRRRVETLAADAGVTLNSAMELAKTPEGMEALAKAAASNKAASRDPMGGTPVTAQEREFLRNPRSAVATEIDDLLGGAGGAIPAAAPASQFTVGQTYTDSNENKAKYLGNGQWQEVR